MMCMWTHWLSRTTFFHDKELEERGCSSSAIYHLPIWQNKRQAELWLKCTPKQNYYTLLTTTNEGDLVMCQNISWPLKIISQVRCHICHIIMCWGNLKYYDINMTDWRCITWCVTVATLLQTSSVSMGKKPQTLLKCCFPYSDGIT